MKRFLLLVALLALPGISQAQIQNHANLAAQTCYSFSLTCASGPCFPWGTDGKSFEGANNQMNITIQVTSGSPNISVEGHNPKATTFFAHSTYTTGADAIFTRRPAWLRVVINTGATGLGVICGNS